MNFRVPLAGIMAAVAAVYGSVALAGQGEVSDTRERIWLNTHNAARAQFGSAPLEWNKTLADEASVWARTLAREQRMRHASAKERKGRGENLWMGTRGYFTPEQMIGSFVGERKHFVSGRFPKVSRTGRWSDVGHYTQIVWPQTRQVGCALAPGEQFEVLVCRYWPAGNRIGDYLAPQKRIANR